jgi:hypothetical protein
VAGLRGVGFTLIPVALLLTDTLQLVTKIGGAIGDWAGNLAFDPLHWLGIIVALLSVGCFFAAGFLAERRGVAGKVTAKADKPSAKALPKSKGSKADPVFADDPEMAEIEALLRKRGIS